MQSSFYLEKIQFFFFHTAFLLLLLLLPPPRRAQGISVPARRQIRLSVGDREGDISSSTENTAFLSSVCKNNYIIHCFFLSFFLLSLGKKKKCSDEREKTTKYKGRTFCLPPSFSSSSSSSRMLIFILIASNRFFSHLKNVYV